MRSLKYLSTLSLLSLFCIIDPSRLYAQANKQNQTNTVFLKENAVFLQNVEHTKRSRAFSLAAEKGWETFGVTKEGKVFTLHCVDDFGMPLYKITENNSISAATINTNRLYTGGSLGLNLSGSTMPNDKIAIWDGGSVLTTHTEFATNRVEIKDGVVVTSTHATHVAGTIMAEGKNPNAKGMAYGLPKLLSFDFNNDNSEMSSYAASLLISNHSYGTIAGWYENTSAIPNRWEFRGQAGANEDYKFGYYDSDAKEWDRICYNAPFYLPVKSAGNYRSSNGPAVGANYYRFNASGSLVNAGARPAGISSNDGYDILGTYSVAKNVMTVAAVNPLPYGTVTPSDITISSFSAWGPTDDGRIKPDISADGVNVTSTSNAAGGASYTTYSGTSMSAPSVTGSLVLLQELYNQKNSAFMRAATLKALTIGTASEAGANPGPDYIFGWGLMNTESAAKAILNKGTKSMMSEKVLNQGGTETFNVVASGDGPIIATISWTDPEIDVIPVADALNNPSLRLVNDLDLRANDGSNTFLPWVLNPANPAAAATKGDNFRDNVEQIYIANAVPGKTYTFTISHKGTLQRGAQAYSVVVTGIGGNPYCASAPSSTNDSKITGLSLANINYTASSGCTSYNDFTNQTVELEKARTYPLVLSLGTCGANFNKVAKVFIDWNSDGDFNDANEIVATSNVINGNGQLTANITVPSTVNVNNFSLLRVVLAETNDAANVQSCGTYNKGETLDYRIKFLNLSTDVGITNINEPLSNCANTQQKVTVVIRNFGTQSISNIPVTVTVKDGSTTVSTLNGTFTNEIKPSEEREFSLPGFYAAVAGKTYSITAKTSLNIDPISSNDEFSKSEQISLPPSLVDQSALYCDNNKQYQLSANGDGVTYWYKDATSTTPFAQGNSITTTEEPTNNSYFAGLNEYTSTFGPVNKYEARLGSGTYLQTSGGVSVRTFAPALLESARLYIGHSGTIRFYVKNNIGVEVSSSTVKVTATRSVPVAGLASDDLTDQGQVYTLNLKFPTAGNYTIHTDYEDDATIFRNNSVPRSIYPLSSQLDIFNIISNDAAQPGSFYYYFYDLKIKAFGCLAVARVEVPVSKLAIIKNGEELVSSVASGNQWYVNGEKIEGATARNYKPLKAGKYQVWAAINATCTSISEEFVFLPGGKGDNEIKLSVFPLPASQDLTVAFELAETQPVIVSIVNIVGQKVYERNKGNQTGIIIDNLDVSKLPRGTYILNIRVKDKIYSKKIAKL
ncbi:S8 family serine peptidase [Pedobacter xixiisoli]|uniref:Por secretion system C-terminal sorting domain-containing protein n=1 Tax=Pedobacter xixiisoli TaxID=1476464 RepID=A0A286A7R6_9SPHI|nr:S8 family serine peptidase [Pedobacter xixiisoli]SOD17954.1 Por secretion system C-terminal sorting domain-containing protein [Pedobacter xixiisoli]